MKDTEPVIGHEPYVSIVIPARNASQYLASCLDSIEKLDYPRDAFEVIVADNGSNDGTARIARERGACVVDAAGLRVGGVRNRGASVAKGAILAFTDSDILVGANWIGSAVGLLRHDGIGAVGGGCLSPDSGTWVEKAWPTRAVSASTTVNHLGGSSLIFKRDLFERLEGFDETLIAAEDDDLSQRIRDLHLELRHVPDCTVIHLGYPQTLVAVARRQVWHGSSIVLGTSRTSDPVTLLTYLFLLGSLCLPPALALAFRFPAFVLIDILILLAVPLVMAVRKALKGNEHYSRLPHFLRLWIIFVYYFVGRCAGMFSRLVKRFGNRQACHSIERKGQRK